MQSRREIDHWIDWNVIKKMYNRSKINLENHVIKQKEKQQEKHTDMQGFKKKIEI